MGSLFIIITVLFCAISYIKRDFIPLSFTLLWGVAGISLKSVDLFYPIDNYVFTYILISIFAFNLSYIIFSKRFHTEFNPDWEISATTYRIIIIAHIVSYVITIPILIKSLAIILSGGWAELRLYAYSESILFSKLTLYLYTWGIVPIFIATQILSVILFFSKSKYRHILLILSLLDVLIACLSFGGRYALVRFCLFFLIALIFKRNFNQIPLKIKFKYLVLGSVIFFILQIMTRARSIGDLNFGENLYVYFFGSFAYFNQITSDPYLCPQNMYYGNETLGFITSIPQLLAYIITNENYMPEYLENLYSNEFLEIGQNINYNAHATIMYPMWLDGREVGIFLGMFFLAFLYNYYKNRAYKFRYMFDYAFLIYIAFTIIMSTMSYSLISFQHSMTLVLLYILTRKSKLQS